MSPPVGATAKGLGAYYTPATMADFLADWVVQTGDETLLEPSIGNGALLRAALSCAERKFPNNERVHMISCDIDGDALNGVRSWLTPDRLLQGNFLDFEPECLPPVDGIIANPPFVA